MKKPNLTVILKCQTRLINNYLSKGFYIIEQNKDQLSLIPNDVKLIIILIGKLDTDYAIVKNKAVSVVAKTIKQLYLQKNMHMTYKKDFYNIKEKEINDLSLEYLVPVMDDIEHPEWI